MWRILSRNSINLIKNVNCSFSVNANHVNDIDRWLSQSKIRQDIGMKAAVLDWNYILDEKNLEEIERNNNTRKGFGDIRAIHQLYKEYVALKNDQKMNSTFNEKKFCEILQSMYERAVDLPNLTHPNVPIGDESKAKCVLKHGKSVDEDIDGNKKWPSVDQISKKFDWLREEGLGNYSTSRGYILKNELAHLENALINYTIKYLFKKGFTLVSVPDILHHSIIESCGFQTAGERTQVFKLDYGDSYGKYCLSGTSEMSLGGLLRNRVFDESELPLKLCAVSRCFRAEVSGSEKEGKLYRLHEFTKVEMFIVTPGESSISNEMHENLVKHQTDLFSKLDFHYRLLDMPSEELGSPAYRKYDIEAWMPFNKTYGEISSTSNCTDYQSRRLNITYKKKNSNNFSFVHTLNGTACAVPRLLTCIVESNWDEKKGLVRIPQVLRDQFNNAEYFKKPVLLRFNEAIKMTKKN